MGFSGCVVFFSQILVIEHDSEIWPVAWTQSDAMVSPCILSLICFVCSYGGVSRGSKFSLLDSLKIRSIFKQREQFDSKFSWSLCRLMVLI